MPSITLSAEEVEPGVLPPVCIVCGSPATVRRSVGFSWVPPLSYLVLLIAVWAWVIVYLIVRRAMTVEVPTCARHRRHWAARKAVLLGGLAATTGVVLAPMLLPPEPGVKFPIWGFVGGAAVFVATVVTFCVMRFTGVRAAEITRDQIELAGVSPAFQAAVKAGRAEYARRMRAWRERHNQAGPEV